MDKIQKFVATTVSLQWIKKTLWAQLKSSGFHYSFLWQSLEFRSWVEEQRGSLLAPSSSSSALIIWCLLFTSSVKAFNYQWTIPDAQSLAVKYGTLILRFHMLSTLLLCFHDFFQELFSYSLHPMQFKTRRRHPKTTKNLRRVTRGQGYRKVLGQIILHWREKTVP